MRHFIALALFLLSSVCYAADTRFGALVLLQPDFVLQERGLNVQEFADFIKSTQAITEKAWKKVTLPKSSGFLVLAVREGGKVNAWLDMEPAISHDIENSTIQLLRSRAGFHVSKGTIIFAIKASINGASETTHQTPFPKEWEAAMKSKAFPVETENLVQMVWP